MSSTVKWKTSLLNFVELGRRAWDFFNQDHLLATILSIFTTIFIRWFFTQDSSMLPAFGYAAFALIGVTGLKYRYDLVNRKQRLIEEEHDTRISMEKVERHFQMEVIMTMLGSSNETSISILQHSISHLEQETVDTGVLKTLTNVVIDSQKFISNKINLIGMPYKLFVPKFFGGDKLDVEEPTLSNLPHINAKEMLEQLETEKAVDPNEIDQKTKDLQDMNKPTDET